MKKILLLVVDAFLYIAVPVAAFVLAAICWAARLAPFGRANKAWDRIGRKKRPHCSSRSRNSYQEKRNE